MQTLNCGHCIFILWYVDAQKYNKHTTLVTLIIFFVETLKVKHSIATGHPMCIDFFVQGFTNFSSIFEPYTKYCAEQSTCQFYCKELNRSNSLFTAYLAWCEAQKECNRLVCIKHYTYCHGLIHIYNLQIACE